MCKQVPVPLLTKIIMVPVCIVTSYGAGYLFAAGQYRLKDWLKQRDDQSLQQKERKARQKEIQALQAIKHDEEEKALLKSLREEYGHLA